ncbi:MAG TPA: hypothetical protein VF021_05035, partial [Longimicrobiales bacterium]
WRKEWSGAAQQDFPFLWVQLPNFGAVDSVPPLHADWAILRDAQTAALSLPNTGQAVIIDLGDPEDIHPRAKQPVGHRLALQARKVAYGEKLIASGPTYRRHTIAGAEVRIEFDNVADGLTTQRAQPVCGFALAGADRRFVAARARIARNRVVVSSPRVSSPVAARYAWSNSPPCANLFNRAGLPARPFRTDDW